MIAFRHFDAVPELEENLLRLIAGHMTRPVGTRHAMMLSGGRTPQGIYSCLTDHPPECDANLHLLLSDERYVSPSSEQSNLGVIRAMVSKLGISDSRVIGVHTELALGDAADRYHRDLSSFLENGGRIPFGMLGVGADGHTASLFSHEDLERGRERYAIPVSLRDGPDRISVTPTLLARVERIIFLVTGIDKKEIVERMNDEPERVIAARAVAQSPNVELWYSASQGSG